MNGAFEDANNPFT